MGLLHSVALLTDFNGKILQTVALNSNNQLMSIANYPEGIYIIKLQNGEVFKIVKNN